MKLPRTERMWLARLAKGPRVQQVFPDEAVRRLVNKGLVSRNVVRVDSRTTKTVLTMT